MNKFYVHSLDTHCSVLDCHQSIAVEWFPPNCQSGQTTRYNRQQQQQQQQQDSMKNWLKKIYISTTTEC